LRLRGFESPPLRHPVFAFRGSPRDLPKIPPVAPNLHLSRHPRPVISSQTVRISAIYLCFEFRWCRDGTCYKPIVANGCASTDLVAASILAYARSLSPRLLACPVELTQLDSRHEAASSPRSHFASHASGTSFGPPRHSAKPKRALAIGLCRKRMTSWAGR
jgi:hypothetical protein